MLDGGVGAQLVVHDYGADGVGLKFAADHHGGDAALFEIGQNVNVDEQPIRQHDQRFDAAVEQHFQVAFEAGAFVVDVGENGKVRRLIESVLDPAQDKGAKGIGHVENHHSHGVTALAAQRPGKQVGAVTQALGGTLNTLLRGRGYVTGQGRVVQNDGDGGRRETTLLGHIADGDHCG